jgi:hypothetical protein
VIVNGVARLQPGGPIKLAGAPEAAGQAPAGAPKGEPPKGEASKGASSAPQK